jgi:5-methylcytosine-specific restriction endonuclease McrA
LSVFVLDKNGVALMPCSEKRARLLLERNRARVHRVMPFVIRLVDRKAESCEFQKLRLKLDPGSKTTGIALVRETEDEVVVLNLVELVHRGRKISEALTARRAMRRRRRGDLRYREARFQNRTRLEGWLAPSLMHRVQSTMSMVNRIRRWAPITAISSELVRFDMQKLENPEISGVEYQQGTLAGYEVKEYLLEKFGRRCVYCDAQDVPLEVEHIKAVSTGGTHRVSNLTISCRDCNEKKDNRPVHEFLAGKPELLKKLLAQAKAPLKDAAAVNATRWKLFNALRETGLPVESGTGGRTKWNRTRFGIPKTHALDAVCVGEVKEVLSWRKPTLTIKSTGRGSYQRTRLTAGGFPRGYLMRQKQIKGFQTGDMVKAIVPDGKKVGTHVGRVAVRATGSFNIQTGKEVIQGISHRHCKLIQRNDGYGYSTVAYIDSEQVSHKARIAPQSTLYLPGLKAEVSRAN